MSNPQMQELMERNPEIRHALNDPSLLRQTMELARNPAAMQEHLRNQDRVMSNLESMPGGSAALQRAFTDIQSPMMDSLARNPFASLASNNSEPSETPTTENTEPLPNPWGGSNNQQATNNTTTGRNTTSNTNNASSGNNTNNMFGANMAGMFNTSGVQDMMSQLTSNTDMMTNMMQSPYVRSMMQQMANNPETMQQMLGSNPLFANNPMMQQMGNPRTQQALRQIQEGMQQLQSEAPGLFPGAAGLGGLGGAATGGNQTTGNNQSGAGNIFNNQSAGGMLNNPDILNMMRNLMGGQQQGTNSQEPPEERYRAQLEQLVQMGFTNRENNIRALQATNGEVNRAVEFLLTH